MFKKRFCLIALVLVFAFASGSCASAEKAEYVPIGNSAASLTSTSNMVVAYDASANVAATQENVPVAEPTATSEPVVAESSENKDAEPALTLSASGYTIEVLSASVGKDGVGNDCIVMKMKYTNDNSQELQLLFLAMDTVTQDGKVITMDGMIPNAEDPSQYAWVTPIKDGQSIIASFIYPYSGSNSPLDVSMKLMAPDGSMRVLNSGSCTLEIK